EKRRLGIRAVQLRPQDRPVLARCGQPLRLRPRLPYGREGERLHLPSISETLKPAPVRVRRGARRREMSTTIGETAARFRSLHVRGKPLVLFNIWDVGSSQAVAAAGAQALATGSWSVANANGYADGERVPLDLAMENLARIVRSTELPVTVD